MSFFCNRGGVVPGMIHGSALDGLRTRVAISVKRVLDSCKKQLNLDRVKLLLKCMPTDIEKPYTFVNAVSTQVEAQITDLSVHRLEERPCFARIKCAVTVPLQVTFLDGEGNRVHAKSEIKVCQDIVMYVPEASIFPFEIVAVASCSCPSGVFESDTVCFATACLTIITKVVADTDLLVPSYGYCPTPNAIDYEEQVCNKFFELPLYPSGR